MVTEGEVQGDFVVIFGEKLGELQNDEQIFRMSARDNNCGTSITLSFEQLRLKRVFDLETHKRGSPTATPSPQTLQRHNERGGLALRCDMARWAWPQHSPSAVQRLPSSHYCSSLNLMTSLAKICQHRPLQSSIGGELSAHFQASL